ncbi:MAG: hypothetical protein RR370_01865 [Synergistaceae bacterium]
MTEKTIIEEIFNQGEYGERIVSIGDDDGAFEFNVSHFIPIGDMTSFVESAVRLCFETETEEYLPEYQHFAFNAAVLVYFTSLELPKNIEELYQAILCTDIMDKVTAIVNKTQLAQLSFAFDKRVAEKIQKQKEAMFSPSDEMYLSIKKVFNNAGGILEILEDFISELEPQKLNGLLGLIENFAEGDIDSDKIKKMMGLLGI